MKIERVELILVELPLVEPFETSFGRESLRPCVLVKARSDGLVGWGECVAGSGPWYSYETVETAWHVLKGFLIPAVLGRPLEHPETMAQGWARVRGHPMAKAGLEAALWDLWAQAQGISLREALGGVKERIESGISLGIQPSQLKIRPGWDVQVVRAVRERFGPIPLSVDANAAYTLSDLDTFRALDRFELRMIEQPFRYDDLVDHAELQKRLKTPICLDESVPSPEAAAAFTICASRGASPSGAAGCSRRGSAGRTTSLWRRCPASPSRTTCRRAPATIAGI